MIKKFNKNIFRQETKSTMDKLLRTEAKSIAKDLLLQKTDQYINEIETHPISKELKNGPSSQNISNTLDGDGNLFSFIGFEQGSKPIEEVVSAIKANTNIKEISVKNNIIKYRVDSPSLEELYSITPMPFEVGMSWLKNIEKGISGFSYYLYGKIFPNSRSGRAIQSHNRIRKNNYKPKDYFTYLYSRFIESFKS